jgi:hypothetical protein
MKVKELIKKLQKFDENLPVTIDRDDNGYYCLDNVSLMSDAEYDGEYLSVNIKSSNES